jgi:ATP-binding cassette subfamily C protein
LTDATIRRGQYIGIVGHSGAGKTTLINLILGLLTPTRGRILVDGHDINEHISTWQANIGYVPQDLFFLDETIRRNVAFGVAEELIDDGRVVEALRLASLWGDVTDMPDGLNTSIGEDAARLSGGQRQRLAIARALYNEPEVLVMDEATADLDNETERIVTETLASLRGTKTIIVIAHRLRAVRNCDTLFFMQDGRIVDRGTFDDLEQRNEKFNRLAQLEVSRSRNSAFPAVGIR